MSKEIFIVSTSIADYDRRLQRVIQSLLDWDYSVHWISRGTCVMEGLIHHSIQSTSKSGISFYRELNVAMSAELRKHKPKLIYAVDLDSLWGVFRAKAGAKVIFDSHEYFTEVPELLSKPLKKWIWSKVADWYIPKCDAHITVNQTLAEIFTALYKVPFSVLRNVPMLKEDIGPKEKSKRLIYQGAINEGRGVELALEALEQLEDYSLILAGEGDLSSKIKRLISDKQLEQRVDWHGWVLPKDLHTLSSQASIGLNMLNPASKNYDYSLANKCFDYIQAGIPAIHMDFPEYRKINAKYDVSILVKEYTSDALVKAVRSIEQPSEYDRRRTNCLVAKQEWHWAKEVTVLSKICDSLTP